MEEHVKIIKKKLEQKKYKEHKKIESFEEYIEKREFKYGEPVYLCVYHLFWINYILQIFGLGLFHTTIEINEKEYSFGSTKEDIPGIFLNKAGELKHLTLKEKIYLGNTLYKEERIYKLLYLQSPYWMGRTYDPFVKNCNHFTNFFSRILLNGKVYYPSYINKLSKYGMLFASFYPPIKRLYGDFAKRFTNSNIDVFSPIILSNGKLKNKNRSKDSLNNIYDQNNSKTSVQEVEFKDGNIIIKIPDNSKDEDKFKAIDNKNNNLNQLNQNSNLDNILKNIFELNPFLNKFNYDYLLQNSNSILKEFFEILKEAEESLERKNDLKKSIELFHKALYILDLFIEENEKINPIEEIEFNKMFDKESFTKIKKTTISMFIKQKILHELFYIYYLLKNINEMEKTVLDMLLIDKNDYFAIFNFSYVRYKQVRIPESDELLGNAIELSKSTNNKSFERALHNFESILNIN